ncbi:MAG: hypothetical protein P8N02_18805 [Actinomycetota bacterium]|nr:hypothetical protein [Actinomycetota bacterium]
MTVRSIVDPASTSVSVDLRSVSEELELFRDDKVERVAVRVGGVCQPWVAIHPTSFGQGAGDVYGPRVHSHVVPASTRPESTRIASSG